MGHEIRQCVHNTLRHLRKIGRNLWELWDSKQSVFTLCKLKLPMQIQLWFAFMVTAQSAQTLCKQKLAMHRV